MIIMKSDATKEQIKAVVKEVEDHGLRTDVSRGDFRINEIAATCCICFHLGKCLFNKVTRSKKVDFEPA